MNEIIKGEVLRLDSGLATIIIDVSDNSIEVTIKDDGYECAFRGDKGDAVEIRDVIARVHPGKEAQS